MSKTEDIIMKYFYRVILLIPTMIIGAMSIPLIFCEIRPTIIGRYLDLVDDKCEL